MIDVSLLKVLFDNDEMIRKYLVVFRDDVPVSLYNLKDYITNLDWDSASITAHSLKSQLQYLKEESVSNLAYEIEKLCEEPNHAKVEEINVLLGEMNSALSHIFEKIDRYLAEK
jgi:HPt (histidine-containing phosphotransfer) domain-containing protein